MAVGLNRAESELYGIEFLMERNRANWFLFCGDLLLLMNTYVHWESKSIQQRNKHREYCASLIESNCAGVQEEMNTWVTKLNDGIAWAAFQSARSGQVTSPSHKGKSMAQVRRGVTSPPSMAHSKRPAAPAPSFPAAPMHSPPSAPESLSSTLQSTSAAAAAYAVTAPPTLITQEALPVAAVAAEELLSPIESVPPTSAAQLAEKAPAPARQPATRSGSQASSSARSQPVGATTESSSRTSSVAGRAAISSDVAAAAAAGRSTPAPESSEPQAPQSPPLPSRLSESSPAPWPMITCYARLALPLRYPLCILSRQFSAPALDLLVNSTACYFLHIGFIVLFRFRTTIFFSPLICFVLHEKYVKWIWLTLSILSFSRGVFKD